MRQLWQLGLCGAVAAILVTGLSIAADNEDDLAIVAACAEMVAGGLRDISTDRSVRFEGKVGEVQARCRGGQRAVSERRSPWVDWSNYWGAGDASTRSERTGSGSHVFDRNKRGLDGALLDLEYQRMELIKFNLFDNRTFEQYLANGGTIKKVWNEFRLPADHPSHRELRISADGVQLCTGNLIRFRTLTGICNDAQNPAMGAIGQLFGRNVEFEATFPDLERDPLAKNRHGGRIALLQPDPQVISRKLFTRDQSATPQCNSGQGTPDGTADCSYKKAPFFNVLAAFWIQFMTHDWFAHQDDGRANTAQMLDNLGCRSERVNNVETPLSPERARELGCRGDEKMETALAVDPAPAESIQHNGSPRLRRAHKTSRNHVTAWWDASQLYGFDERSRQRVKRDPADPAKLVMQASGNDRRGYLPEFAPPCGPSPAQDCDPIQPEWRGQEATAFPDSWSIGLSFFHNLFAREHNIIVDAFRQRAKEQPKADSGLRHPDRPDRAITYDQLTNDELFEVARLIVAAEIAKIHTIEWTTQLLYNDPLHTGMNSNWSGLFKDDSVAGRITRDIASRLAKSSDPIEANQLYSAFAAGPGIVGRGNSRRFPAFMPDWLSWDRWSLANLDDVNGGTNHFGSPFNFPEEFVSVYRLHALLPDILQFRELGSDPNAIRRRVPLIETFRGKATRQMRDGGLANWGLTMGRQRLGTLSLRNQPQFLQNLDLRPRLDTTIDLAALDIIRDRERGVPRFNEFRRQIGLRQLTSFDDFVDARLPPDSPERAEQLALVKALREVYGQHRCDDSKVITSAQRNPAGRPITDCLGHPDGSLVDNIEDVDIVVGFLAETTRPHGFAISETQFHIFIINASRRLFSDRFLTSSFRPEFYGKLGIEWVMNNGPTGQQWEDGEPNGHRQEISPLKRILLRAMPELAGELKHVVNVFDPWARDRGTYYSLQWKARADAASDPAFAE